MKEPIQPRRPYNRSQKHITTRTRLVEQPIPSYESSLSYHKLTDAMLNIGEAIKNRDPDTIQIHLDVKSGYYEDKDYTLVIEEVIHSENPNYIADMRKLAEEEKQYELDLAEYHKAMTKYLEWKAKQR
jgi:hypothetical protein